MSLSVKKWDLGVAGEDYNSTAAGLFAAGCFAYAHIDAEGPEGGATDSYIRGSAGVSSLTDGGDGYNTINYKNTLHTTDPPILVGMSDEGVAAAATSANAGGGAVTIDHGGTVTSSGCPVHVSNNNVDDVLNPDCRYLKVAFWSRYIPT